MSIQFPCSGCGKILAVGDENVGRQAKCPHCGLVSLVPEPASAVYDANLVEDTEEVGTEGASSSSPFGASSPAGSGQTEPGSPFAPPGQMMLEPINSHLVDAILVTICCCLPFGIVGIIFAAMCKSQIATGNYALAREYSRKANMWNMIGLFLGLSISALYFLMVCGAGGG